MNAALIPENSSDFELKTSFQFRKHFNQVNIEQKLSLFTALFVWLTWHTFQLIGINLNLISKYGSQKRNTFPYHFWFCGVKCKLSVFIACITKCFSLRCIDFHLQTHVYYSQHDIWLEKWFKTFNHRLLMLFKQINSLLKALEMMTAQITMS